MPKRQPRPKVKAPAKTGKTGPEPGSLPYPLPYQLPDRYGAWEAKRRLLTFLSPIGEHEDWLYDGGPIAELMLGYAAEVERGVAETARVRATMSDKEALDELDYREYEATHGHPLYEIDTEHMVLVQDSTTDAAVLRAGRAVRAEIDALKRNGHAVPAQLELALEALRKHAFYTRQFSSARIPGTRSGGRPVTTAETTEAVTAHLVNLTKRAGEWGHWSEVSKILTQRFRITMTASEVSRTISNIKRKDAARTAGKCWLK